jgi:hypothetical protein
LLWCGLNARSGRSFCFAMIVLRWRVAGRGRTSGRTLRSASPDAFRGMPCAVHAKDPLNC